MYKTRNGERNVGNAGNRGNVIFRGISPNILGNFFKHSGECREKFDIPRNVWWHSPYSLRSSHFVPRYCILGFIYSPIFTMKLALQVWSKPQQQNGIFPRSYLYSLVFWPIVTSRNSQSPLFPFYDPYSGSSALVVTCTNLTFLCFYNWWYIKIKIKTILDKDKGTLKQTLLLIVFWRIDDQEITCFQICNQFQ